MRRLLLLGFLSLASVSAHAQGLSKQNVIDLHQAGIEPTVLIQKIERDGIDFEMTADVMLELKKAGVPAAVMKVLLDAKVTKAPKSAELQSDFASGVRVLYAQEKYLELADLLQVRLQTNPADHKSRALLVMTLLKAKERNLAVAEFDKLKAQPQDETSQKYVLQVDRLFTSLAQQEGAKNALIAALKNYRRGEVMSLIDELPASPAQKEVLKLNVELYQGRFQEARQRAARIEANTMVERQRVRKIEQQIAEAENTYKVLNEHLELYLHSPLAASYCYFSRPSDVQEYFPELGKLSIQDYVDSVNHLSQLTPLSEDAMDLVFHAAMLSSKYVDFEKIADRILAAQGRIRIQFYASDRFFGLVIDGQRKRLYTEQDNHPFRVKYSPNGWSGGRFNETDTNTWNSALVPFDLSFDEVRSLGQKARSRFQVPELMVSKGYALKLEPGGVAPHYALMHLLHCTAGQAAQQTATRNLGLYILHVTNNKSVKAELQEIAQAGSGLGDAFFAAMVGVYGQMAAQRGDTQAMATASMITDMKARMDADRDAIRQTQDTAWYSLLVNSSFSFAEGDLFRDLEQLLDVI